MFLSDLPTINLSSSHPDNNITTLCVVTHHHFRLLFALHLHCEYMFNLGLGNNWQCRTLLRTVGRSSRAAVELLHDDRGDITCTPQGNVSSTLKIRLTSVVYLKKKGKIWRRPKREEERTRNKAVQTRVLDQCTWNSAAPNQVSISVKSDCLPQLTIKACNTFAQLWPKYPYYVITLCHVLLQVSSLSDCRPDSTHLSSLLTG